MADVLKINPNQEQSISDFEAACFYDWMGRKDKVNSGNDMGIDPTQIVVLDADNYAVAFCTCTSDGTVQTVHTKKSQNAEEGACLKEIETAFQKISYFSGKNVFEALGSSLGMLNASMQTFYKSEKRMNAELLEKTGVTMDCSGMNNIFEPVMSRWSALLDNICDGTDFNEDDVIFIIIGKAALLYPIEYVIRKSLTYDPFLPDDRFVNDSYSDKPDQISGLGRNAYMQKLEAERSVSVKLILMEQDKKDLVPLSVSKKNNVRYFGPILVAENEKLEFELNGQVIEKGLPYSVSPIKLELINLGVTMEGDKPLLHIQKYNHPTTIYELKLE